MGGLDDPTQRPHIMGAIDQAVQSGHVRTYNDLISEVQRATNGQISPSAAANAAGIYWNYFNG
jgi:hypothetical protein